VLLQNVLPCQLLFKTLSRRSIRCHRSFRTPSEVSEWATQVVNRSQLAALSQLRAPFSRQATEFRLPPSPFFRPRPKSYAVLSRCKAGYSEPYRHLHDMP
jgi:hypothetical protein